MKKYKIRVRVLPENICCGFILDGGNLQDALDNMEILMFQWDFDDYSIISIGEL